MGIMLEKEDLGLVPPEEAEPRVSSELYPPPLL